MTGCGGWKMNYPENWAPLTVVENNKCQSIEGKYKAVSVPHPEYNKESCEPAVGKGWFCHSLPEDLLDLKLNITDETWVMIVEPDDKTIDITVGENDIIIHHSVLAKNNLYECNDEGVMIKVGPQFMAGDGAVGANLGYKYTFRKALDGSLTLKETTSGGGLMFLIIPVGGSSIQWWKWEPM